MKENGSMDKEMGMASKYGQMNPGMKEIGQMIKQMALGNFTMLMEIFTKEPGVTTKLMEEEPTLMQMEPSILVIGKMTNNMALVLRLGLTMQFTKVNTGKERRTAMENSILLMVLSMRENSK